MPTPGPSPAPQRARRMSPEDRREQLLDSAVTYIVERGLSGLTLENVALQAGVSKPLIYKYFAKREDLLKAVLEREYKILGSRRLGVLPANTPLEPLIRASNKRAFDYLYERGPIIRLLSSDRGVAELVLQRERDERNAITEHFVERLKQAYGVPHDVAVICSIMTVNAPILAARALKKAGITPEQAANVWSDFAVGGWLALEDKARQLAPAKAPPKRKAATKAKASRAKTQVKDKAAAK